MLDIQSQFSLWENAKITATPNLWFTTFSGVVLMDGYLIFCKESTSLLVCCSKFITLQIHSHQFDLRIIIFQKWSLLKYWLEQIWFLIYLKYTKRFAILKILEILTWDLIVSWITLCQNCIFTLHEAVILQCNFNWIHTFIWEMFYNDQVNWEVRFSWNAYDRQEVTTHPTL